MQVDNFIARDQLSTLNDRLSTMEAIGRRSKIGLTNYPVALLSIFYLRRKYNISWNFLQEKHHSLVISLARSVEDHCRIDGRPLSHHLFSGINNVEPEIIDRWLQIAAEDWTTDGFVTWLCSKIDEIVFSQHHDTPSSVCSLVAAILHFTSARSILDPACGTGGLLAAMAASNSDVELYGQEQSPEAWAWAQLRFLVLGYNHANLASGDALTHPAFIRQERRNNFDAVVTNPPFGLQLSEETVRLLSKQLGSLIPRYNGRLSSETAYVQVALNSLSDNGNAVIVVPNGFLSRGGIDEHVREQLIRRDTVKAVIALPERLFAPATNIGTSLLLIGRKKLSIQINSILFIDASKSGIRDSGRMLLDDGAVQRITQATDAWQDEEGFAQIVNTDEVLRNSSSLYPPRYVGPSKITQEVNFDLRRKRISDLDDQYSILRQKYDDIYKKLMHAQ